MADTGDTVLCEVYRTPKKADTYLYLPLAVDWTELPDNLQQLFSGAELVTRLKLTPERRLARLTGAELIQHLKDPGFYLQLPPAPDNLLKQLKASRGEEV